MRQVFYFELVPALSDGTPIDWNKVETEVRPADVNPESWAVTWAHFKVMILSLIHIYEPTRPY